MKKLKKGRARRAKAKRIEAMKQDLLLAKKRNLQNAPRALERVFPDYVVKPWASKEEGR